MLFLLLSLFFTSALSEGQGSLTNENATSKYQLDNVTREVITTEPTSLAHASTIVGTSKNSDIKDEVEYCSGFLGNQSDSTVQRLFDARPCSASGEIQDSFLHFVQELFNQHKCGNSDSLTKYTRVLYCMIIVGHHSCLVMVNKEITAASVPSQLAVRETLRELCAVNDSLARSCMFPLFSEIGKCVHDDVVAAVNMQGKDLAYDILNPCRLVEIKAMCMWDTLQTCEGKTANIMTNLISVLLKPPLCANSCLRIFQTTHLVLIAIVTVMKFI
ncbi:uncharacterized protein LOC131956610 isoform X2 [Physella acuta]|uniref:uncharacterized protein LOC131956610 isoform X2 n=1 Tax=Physella acuta TaxID=109671 RepID=UPI0027DDFA89|nr:uncharacterized protein LOC131956610 isoform X2 [Physella acuta]